MERSCVSLLLHDAGRNRRIVAPPTVVRRSSCCSAQTTVYSHRRPSHLLIVLAAALLLVIAVPQLSQTTLLFRTLPLASAFQVTTRTPASLKSLHHHSRSSRVLLSQTAAPFSSNSEDAKDDEYPHNSGSSLSSSSSSSSSAGTGNNGIAGGDGGVRFLGKGDRAIVRPGVVLLAPTNEYHHYYRQAAIFVFAMGEVEQEDDGVYVVRGVIVDHPTPFTLAEMMPGNKIQGNPLADNLMFRGGDKGGDGVILLHNRKDLGQSAIGLSGIFQGGWDAALAACAKGDADAGDFKVFFNYCEFTELEVEDLLKSNEDGDCWASVEVGSDFILSEDWDRGDCWKRLRNAVSQHMREPNNATNTESI